MAWEGEGIYLAGWATTEDAAEPEEVILAEDGLDLYPVWTIDVIVTYNANGGYIEYEGQETYDYETRSGERFYDLTNVYHTNPMFQFDGWYDAAEGGNKLDEITIVNGAMTVYAHWNSLDKGTLEPETDIPVSAESGLVYY